MALANLFHLGQRMGFDILPRHFYSEIPDISKLRNTDYWRKPFSMIGVTGADIDEQLRFVRSTVSASLEDRLRKGDIYESACGQNGEAGYGPIEADFLHAFIVCYQPTRIIQIGCGVSTAVCLAAAKEAGYQPDIVCVEPYPTEFLKCANGQGKIKLIEKPVETLEYSFLSQLKNGGLFFVDSTHTLGPGGEVSRIILEILPRLSHGTYVHFHDILFPYDYPENILDSALFFGHESVLLHAFLTYNYRVKILASLSMLHYERQSELCEMLPHYNPRKTEYGLTTSEGHYPSSIYLQMT
jgi:hypothetical protein